jgi:hypothetical protein
MKIQKKKKKKEKSKHQYKKKNPNKAKQKETEEPKLQRKKNNTNALLASTVKIGYYMEMADSRFLKYSYLSSHMLIRYSVTILYWILLLSTCNILSDMVLTKQSKTQSNIW